MSGLPPGLELPAIAGAVVLLLWWLAVVRPFSRRTAPQETAPASAEPTEGLLVPVAGVGVSLLIWHLTETVAPAVAVLLLWTGLFAVLRSRRRARREALEERHALEAISTASRILRAGIPFSGMVTILAEQSQGRTGVAFREILRRERLGEELSSAIRKTLLASGLPALRAFGLALEMHLSAGGNLAEAGERIARSLLERSFIRRRARTILAYGRLAATLLAVFPLLALLLMSASVDDYWPFLAERPEGNFILGLAAVLVVTGLFLIERIGRFDRPSARAAS
jgi:Flp pilus assembly protein TadB